MADGGDLILPVHIVTGTKPGPTLCLTAALHGDETGSIVTVMEIVNKTNVDELSGTIVVVSVCNPPGLEALTYHTPMDGKNLEVHVFPGDKQGSLSERIAYVLGSEIVTKGKVDVHIDVHAPPLSSAIDMNYLYIASRQYEELCLVQGYEVNYRGPEGGLPGSFVEHAIGEGIQSAHSNGYVRDIENVMKHLGMISGELVLPDRQFITQAPRIEYRPTHGGMLYPEFSLEQYPDQIVAEGTLLARVFSPYTFEELERFVAPCDAAVFFWPIGKRRFNPGEWAFVLGRMEDAEWVRGSPV